MFSAQSKGETIGAARKSAPGSRAPRRGRPGIFPTALLLLLIAVVAAQGAAPAFAAVPSTEQPLAEQPSTEQPSTGQPSTGQPSTGQPSTGQPSTEQPSTEQPSAETPAIGDLLDEGVAHYNAGHADRALEAFLSAARLDPAASLPWIWAGIAATAAGKMQDANRYFTEGLARPHTALQERIIRGWLTRLSVFTTAPRHIKPGAPQAIAALARTTNPRLTAAQAAWLGERVVSAAQQHHIDPWLVAAVIYVESKFNQASVSSRGAMGLGQLMPRTARAAGVNPRDAWGNLLGTAMTLSACIREFRDWRLALAAYNAGPRAVYRYGGIPPFAETRWYVTAVLSVYQHIRPGHPG